MTTTGFDHNIGQATFLRIHHLGLQDCGKFCIGHADTGQYPGPLHPKRGRNHDRYITFSPAILFKQQGNIQHNNLL